MTLTGHLPGCKVVRLRDVLPPGEELPPGTSEDVGLLVCVEDCPNLAERRERAIQLARERGWLTDEGWTWDDATS